MFKKENKSEGISAKTIIVIILFILSMLSLVGSKLGVFNITSIQGVKEEKYTSVNEALNSLSYEVNIPENLLNNIEDKKVSCTVSNNTFCDILIGEGEYLISVGPYQGDNYDPLHLRSSITEGLEQVEEVAYEVMGNSISYVECKSNVPTLTNCTVANWNDKKANYGLIVGDKIDTEEVIGLLGINIEDCKEISTKNSDTNNNSEEASEAVEMYDIKSRKVSLKSPCELKVIEANGQTAFSLDGEIILMVVYDAEVEKELALENQDSIEIVNIYDNAKAMYTTINPFEQGSESSENYNKFLNTIDQIIESIVYIG